MFLINVFKMNSCVLSQYSVFVRIMLLLKIIYKQIFIEYLFCATQQVLIEFLLVPGDREVNKIKIIPAPFGI